jgi:hypothetical protein
MFRFVPVALLVLASLLLPCVHGLHFLSEKGKPMYFAAPLRYLHVFSPISIDIHFRFRCFFEDLPPNIIVIVNYEHKDLPGHPRAANPELLKAIVRSEQKDVL